MENLTDLNENEIKSINGGETGDAAEAIGIMVGSIAKWGPIAGNLVGTYKVINRFF